MPVPEDIFTSLFGPQSGRPRPTTPQPLPQIRGRVDDGVLYVRADDVADALEAQAPTTNRRLIDKLRKGARRA